MTTSISVIIPCYRCDQTLNRAIESITNQTITPVEVLLIEDFSNDNNRTKNAITKIIQNYKHLNIIVFENTQNQGPGFSRNIGIKNAISDYIAFLDSDDYWHPKKLQIQYEFMKKNPDVYLSGHYFYALKNFTKIPTFSDLYSFFEITKKHILFSNYFSTPTVMIKNDNKYFFDNTQRYSEDFYLWQRVILSNEKAIKIRLPLAFSFKAKYGEKGLSANLLKMEMGELENYIKLYRDNFISLTLLIVLLIYSFLKFLRRIVISCVRNFFLKYKDNKIQKLQQ